MEKISRVILIVLDSVGAGFLPDAEEYGDLGANTLGHIGEACGLNLPNMEKMGLGNIINIKGVNKIDNPVGLYGKANSASKGKDTTTGHWEIAGIILDKPFPTFPNGFTKEIIEKFESLTGKKVIGNKSASGTEIINELGDKHMESGDLIVYTSADSVFQIAASEDIVPLSELYNYCKIARKMFDDEGIKIGRIIARPFIKENGIYKRTPNRHDYSLKPEKTVLDELKANNFNVKGVGKIYDIFAGEGITETISTVSNEDGINKTLELIKEKFNGVIFTNLVDFDMKYGHRRDVIGYKEALEYFDKRVPEIEQSMHDDDILIITADHGCDPIFKGSDHTREYIPILAYGKGIRGGSLGTRATFADIASTLREIFFKEKSNGSFASEFVKIF